MTNGNLDTTFNGTGKLTAPVAPFLGDDEAFAVGLQSNGTIVVAGRTQVSANPSTYDFFMARYSSTGVLVGSVTITNTFTGITNQDDQAYGLAIGSGDSIYVSGFTFSTASNSYDFALAKYNSNGFLDTSFSGDGKVATNFGGSSRDEAYGIALQSDGRIVVAGRTRTDDTAQWNFALARYQTSGALHTPFDGDGLVTTDFGFNDEAFGVAVQSDGQIVAAGITDAISGVNNGDFALARYNSSDGSLDSTFNGDGRVTTSFGTGDDKAFDVAMQSDGKIVAAGYGTITASNRDFAVARYIGVEFPEVTVFGNGISITDGDTNPRVTDGTDYGSVNQGGVSVSRTFTVQNDGNGTLTLSGLTVPAGYTVTDGLVASLALGASDLLTVRLDTSTAGVKNGQISFVTNDSGENPFNFSITGAVTAILLGDYNRDGSVNAGDYVLWRKTLGQTGIPSFSGADGSGNGSIGPEDYNIWRSHFGSTLGVGSGASVEGGVGSGEGTRGTDADSLSPAMRAASASSFGVPNGGRGGEVDDLVRTLHAAEVENGQVMRDDALLAWLGLQDLRRKEMRVDADGPDCPTGNDVVDDAVDMAFAGVSQESISTAI